MTSVSSTNLANTFASYNQPKKELGKDAFLQILVTQLRSQDPTSPMQDREFIAQMAQFSMLEQMTNLNQSIMQVLDKQKDMSDFAGMIDKKVSWKNTETGEQENGIVTGVVLKEDNYYYQIDDKEIHVEDIIAVESK
jgi:flagellar basal-body rod modification protein FlgD